MLNKVDEPEYEGDEQDYASTPRAVTVHLVSATPYSQSRKHDAPRLNSSELDGDYDMRTWREHLTVDETDTVCIPAMALKQCLDRAAVVLGLKVPGRGKNTYSKHFSSGVILPGNVPLMDKDGKFIKKADVKGESILANSDGKRGGAKRVTRWYPTIPVWQADAVFWLLDDIISAEVFRRHLYQGGIFTGIGRFRAQNGGMYGRFRVEGDMVWEKIEL